MYRRPPKSTRTDPFVPDTPLFRSAANLVRKRIGGPAGLTRFMRAAGDSGSRLDRYETALNLVGPGEIHDTTTPAAMIGLLSALTLGEVLSPSSRRQLIAWMIAGKTEIGRAHV